MANEQYEIYQQGTAAALAEKQLALLNSKASPDASYPSLSAGSATGITGDVETASWMARQTNADGAALIESVKGNTLRWNQLQNVRTTTSESNGVTFTEDGTGKVTASGTSTGAAFLNMAVPMPSIPSGHKVLLKGCPSGGSSTTYYMRNGYVAAPQYFDTGNGSIVTAGENFVAQICVNNGTTVTNLVFRPQLFDLTTMFGAGNEPATVDEFEALYPLPYYPYDSGSLLPVRMEGIETVGFNQFDKNNLNRINGYIDNGSIISNPNHATVYIPCLPNTTYCASRRAVSTNERFAIGWTAETPAAGVSVYGVSSASTSQVVGNNMVLTTTTGADARYIVLWACAADLASAALELLCINLSDPERNGTYEPYWSAQRAIAASTYFPDGMRSAGTVRDELTADEAITRVGSVDLGTLTWTYNTSSAQPFFAATLAGAAEPGHVNTNMDATCARYLAGAVNYIRNNADYDKRIAYFRGDLNVRDSAYTDAATFKAAMSGVMLHYALATPTTTPVTQPMAYRVGRGGTERVMVAEGTMSAPPIFATRYPLDPADLAASIAPVDGPTATTNHQVGDLLMLGFTLCKATQVIVTGETIAIGTNVTRTTVAAELAALSE